MDTSAHEGKAFCAASTAAVISAWVAHGTRVTTSFVACRVCVYLTQSHWALHAQLTGLCTSIHSDVALSTNLPPMNNFVVG